MARKKITPKNAPKTTVDAAALKADAAPVSDLAAMEARLHKALGLLEDQSAEIDALKKESTANNAAADGRIAEPESESAGLTKALEKHQDDDTVMKSIIGGGPVSEEKSLKSMVKNDAARFAAKEPGLQRVAVELIKPFRQYNAGEICGFSPQVVRGLISKNIARPINPDRLQKMRAAAKAAREAYAG